MKGKRFPAEKIINKLRQAEVFLSQGQNVVQISKTFGVTEQAYYRWRKEYGGITLCVNIP
jgi:putative transposase